MPLVPFVPPGLLQEVDGDTLLHRLVSYGYQSDGAVEACLQQGEDADVRNAHGCTPLHSAAQLAYLAGIRLLLKYGADVDARNAHGTWGVSSWSPLYWRRFFCAPLVVLAVLP
jgi:ankyrin repeat protein